jgi:hypothetical protein
MLETTIMLKSKKCIKTNRHGPKYNVREEFKSTMDVNFSYYGLELF